VILKTDWIDSA